MHTGTRKLAGAPGAHTSRCFNPAVHRIYLARASSAAAPGLASYIHPSALLDAACAACCTLLLVTSAARRLAETRRAAAAPLAGATPERAFHGPEPVAGFHLPSAPPHAQPSADCSEPVQLLAPAGAVCPTTPAAAAQGQAPLAAGGLLGEAALACVLLSAASNLAFKLSAASGQQAAARHTAVGLEAAARVARLEAVAAQQAADLAAASRQLDKLQVRTRVTGGDLRRPIAQLQAASAEQSALLSRLAGEAESLRAGLRDTQALLAALQGLSAKQFQVTVDAIKQLRARQAGGAAPGAS